MTVSSPSLGWSGRIDPSPARPARRAWSQARTRASKRGAWAPWIALAAVLAMGGPAARAEVSAESRLAKAQPFMSAVLRAKLGETMPQIHWLDGADRFWMVERVGEGRRYVVVDAATGETRPAFDHTALAAAQPATAAGPASETSLRVGALDLSDPRRPVVTTTGGVFQCDAAAHRCEPKAARGGAGGAASPDGSKVVFRRGFDLWLKVVATGEERRLTQDGVENFAYGDFDSYIDDEKVARRRAGEADPLFGVVWSPDGRYVLGLRQDLRRIPERLLVTEYLPPEGGPPVIYKRRAPVSGDASRPDSALTLIDTQSGTVRRIDIDPQALNDFALGYYAAGGKVWWDFKHGAAFLIGANRGGSRYQLLKADLNTGAVTPLITETAKFNVRLNTFDYALPNVQVLSSGGEAIWYSERDGYGHLYLYDLASGKVKRQLTKGAWTVADLVRVDERTRTIYFTAAGKEAGRHPDYRHLYKVGLDGGEPVLLTPEDADHQFNHGYVFWSGGPWPGSSMSPSGRYLVDSVATAGASSSLVIRTSDGRLVKELVKADPKVFDRLGVRAPELVTAKAADGTTDLYGVLFKPTDFDPNKRYPVIEMTYPGPQQRSAPVTFPKFFASSGVVEPFATAELGFIVLVIDGRGSAYRSRAFREAFFGTEDAFGAADHVAALRDLATTRPYLDLDRVGVTGHSYGGYGSVHAMLLFPDFYKVGVAGVGPADWTSMTDAVSTERYFGLPAGGGGASYQQTSGNVRLAARLRGRLLLIYGGIDEIVPLQEAMKLSDAFIAADRPFDLLIVPNAGHIAGALPYGVKRTQQYFMQYLGGPEARSAGN